MHKATLPRLGPEPGERRRARGKRAEVRSGSAKPAESAPLARPV